MSHLKERKEKDCLNCGAQVAGRYCAVCGQENTEPHESFGDLIQHFIFDLFHFDGKFFESVKYLLFRPGFLTKEYMRGRRLAYLNPIKMYIFTSAIFFLIIFSFFTKGVSENLEDSRRMAITKEAAIAALVQEKDPAKIDSLQTIIHEADSILTPIKETGMLDIGNDSGKQTPAIVGKSRKKRKEGISFASSELPKSLKTYDSLQQALPPSKRDGWVRRFFNRKEVAVNEKYQGREIEMWEKVWDKSIHSLPSMMMISLPFFAFILFLLYVRNRSLFFVDHLIFTLHLYIAQYINLLIFLAISSLSDLTGWQIFVWLSSIQVLVIFFYLYKSLRNFYGQSRRKTLFKYTILNCCLLIIFTFLFISMVVNSMLSI